MLKRIRGAKKYIKLNIQAAFNNLRIKLSQKYFIVFIIPFGLFKFLIIPFSMCNIPASWQTYINNVLGPLLNDICVVFLDNILIWGDSDKKIKTRTFKVLNYLRKKGLYYKLFKCRFKINKVNFLGYLVDYSKFCINPN